MNQTLTLGMIKILGVKVNDSRKNLKKNEELAIKAAGFSGHGYQRDLETFQVTGRLADDLMALMNEEEIEELVSKQVSSEFLAERFNLEAGASIRDLMDEIPLYASVTIAFKRETEMAVEEYRLVLNRRGIAGKGLDEFRVVNFELTAYEFDGSRL